MCNLGLGILEEGYAKGISQGINQIQEQIAKTALQQGHTAEEIAEFTGMNLQFIEKVKECL